MNDIGAGGLSRSRNEIFRQSQREVQVERDDEGIVLAIGSEGDSELPRDEFDEGPIVDYPTVSAPLGEASESGYFASR
jgi:hypothetical protein